MTWPPKTEKEARLDPRTVHLVWKITMRCNLDCAYCFGHASRGPVKSCLTYLGVEHVARVLLDAAGERRFLVDVTGGEPMLVEELFALMEVPPPEKVHIRLQTNGTVYRHFRPALINMAYHSASMSETVAARWWEHLASFIDDGHTMVVQLMAVPGRLDELEELYGRSRELLAPEQIYVRYLQGRHGGRTLPRGYSQEELARIRPLMNIRVAEEEQLRLGPPGFQGRPCRAGQELAVVGVDGEVFRCTGAMAAKQDRLGALKGGFHLASADSSVAACRYPCGCVYQGLWYCR